MTGTWIRITAMGYLVYDITSDPLKLGVISFATSVPQLILSPLSGAFIDRVNRRNLLLVVQFLIVAVMAVTAFLIGNGQITYPLLLVISVILGSLITFDWPVRLALIPALIHLAYQCAELALFDPDRSTSEVVDRFIREPHQLDIVLGGEGPAS